MTPAQFLQRVQRGQVPAVTLFLGNESYQRARCRKALLEAFADAGDGSVTSHDLSQTSLAEAIDDARAMNLFVSRRLVFGGSAEAALPRTRKGAVEDDGDEEEGGSGAAGGFESLAAYVKDPSPGVTLVFEASKFGFEGDDKRKLERVRKFYGAVTDTVEFQRYSPDEARQEAQAMLRRLQVQIAPAALELLLESMGSDVARLSTEIEKLSLFGKPIGLDDITTLVPDARETNIFVLVNALGRRERAKALDVLDTLCRDGEYLPLALSFLSTQFRTALVAQEAGLRNSRQIQDYFGKIGVQMWGGRAEQVAQTTTKFSKAQLEKSLKLISVADQALRSARPDDRIVMERLVTAITA